MNSKKYPLVEAARAYISGQLNEAHSPDLKNELHLDVNEGEERHVIKGLAHTQANADMVYHKVVDAVHKKTKVPTDTIHDIMQDQPQHHALADEPEETSPNYKADGAYKVHKDLDSYVKHHARKDAPMIKAMASED